MFKFSRLLSRFIALGILSGCFIFALIGVSNKAEAADPCPQLCIDGLLCSTKLINGRCVQFGSCFPPDYEGQCPVID